MDWDLKPGQRVVSEPRETDPVAPLPDENGPSAPLGPAVSRRTLLAGAGGGLAALLLAGTAWPTRATALQPALVGTTYVGETSIPGLLVTIVVGEALAGTRREARGYLCDNVIGEWFIGAAEGDAVDLRSDQGGRLQAQLSGDTASGTATLPTGAPIAFQASRATGRDGLYTFTIAGDGSVQGERGDGSRLAGRLLVVGTISTPAGQVEAYEAEINPGNIVRFRAIKVGNVEAGFSETLDLGFTIIWTDPAAPPRPTR